MAKSYDLIVLGAGNAGQAAASTAREAGKSVLLVESRDVGGTCPLRGCVPKKVLVAAAENLEQIRLSEKHGVTTGPAKLDWAKLIKRKQTFVKGAPESMEKNLKQEGIDVVHDKARFVARNKVEINGATYTGKKFVISTGSAPRTLPIPGAAHALTSEEILEMKSQPKSIIFIGAGVIGLEFTHVLARAGSKVFLLQRGTDLLPSAEEDLVAGLVSETKALGVKIFTKADVQSIKKSGSSFQVTFRHAGKTRTLQADAVANTTGRQAVIDDLDLEAAGVKRNKSGIAVDKFLRSVSNPAVFAAGDCIGRPRQLSPIATYEGKIAGHNATHRKMMAPNYAGIPNVIFTIPALASVGQSEKQASEAGRRFRAVFNDMKEWRSARTNAETASLAKVLVEEKSGRILGAHLLGHGAADVIHTFAFAIRFGLTAKDLKDFIYAYPTTTSDVRFLV
jgi:glutathione reductase (NADPH)